MRTKTVLLTAALGVVGAATVSAQVYSVNTVGYVNSELKPGFNLIANPLDNKAANGNTVGNLFGTALGDGATVYKFVSGAYEVANGFTDLFGWEKADQTLAPGEGAFVFISGAAAKTVTFVGDVMQGTLVIDLKKGFNMVSSKVPQAGKLQADLGYVPADGDTVYQHNRGAAYKVANGFTTLFGWGEGDPDIAVGEALWISKEAAGTWTREFTVK